MSSVRRPRGKLFQIRGPTAKKASVSKAVVRTWHHAHDIRGRLNAMLVAFGDEMDVISQVDRHLTSQCLAHQTEASLNSTHRRTGSQCS